MATKSYDTTISTTTTSDNRQGVGGDNNAPVAGNRAAQANAAGSIAAQGSVRLDTTDSRNYGTQVERVGNNSNVNITTSDPLVAMASIEATSQTSRDALAAQLAAQTRALQTVDASTAGTFAAFEAMDQRRSQAVSQTINSATDQAREAAARSESIVQNALNKLADQRAPDGSNVVKIVLGIVVALAVVLGLRAWRGR